MPAPQIEKLLIVQHRDVSLRKIEQDLAHIPVEQRALQARIAEEQANVEAARQSLLAKEVARKDLDVAVQAKEAALQRFRTQQLEVKKNEEYKALTHQIEQTEAEISSLEEREIELMLDIDSAQALFDAEKVEIERRIEAQHKEGELLNQRQANLAASLSAAQSQVAAARVGIEPHFLEHYDRVKKLVKRPPYVVPVEAHKCGGCHLRVSNEVARSALDASEPHFCDQCGRMVYA